MPVVPFTPRKPRSSRARLRLRRSHRSSCTDIREVVHKTSDKPYLQPKGRPLAHGGQLRWLEVREAQRRESTVLLCKFSEAVDDNGKLLDEQSEAFSQEDQVGVAVSRIR